MCRYQKLFIVLGFMTINAMAQDDVRHAYESVVVSNLDAISIQKELDVDRPKVAEYLLARMNTPSKKGDGACPEEVMGRLLNANPGKTIEWLLDKYSQLSAVGRANMAKSLRWSECKEAYEVASVLLADKETVVNQHAAAVAPVSPNKQCVHLRVCDFAFNSLMQMLQKNERLPSNLPRRLTWNISNEERDQAIKRFGDWWTKEFATTLNQKISIAPMRPLLKDKINSLQRGGNDGARTKITN